MQSKTAKAIRKYVIYFVLYAVVGWLYETFLEVVVYRWGFSKRGVLIGPYCVIYGVGALVLIAMLSKLLRKKIVLGKLCITPLLVFPAIMLISTVIELIGSYLMQAIAGGWAWDYSTYLMNFQGRIALNPSLRFGVGGMVFLYVFQPFFEKIVGKLSDRHLAVVSAALVLLLIADTLATLIF